MSNFNLDNLDVQHHHHHYLRHYHHYHHHHHLCVLPGEDTLLVRGCWQGWLEGPGGQGQYHHCLRTKRLLVLELWPASQFWPWLKGLPSWRIYNTTRQILWRYWIVIELEVQNLKWLDEAWYSAAADAIAPKLRGNKILRTSQARSIRIICQVSAIFETLSFLLETF